MRSNNVTLKVDKARIITGYDSSKEADIYGDGYEFYYSYGSGASGGSIQNFEDLKNHGFVVNWDNVHLGETYYLNDDAEMMNMFENNKKQFEFLMYICIAPAFAAIVALFVLYMRKLPDENGELKQAISFYDKIPLVVQISLCVVFYVLTFAGLADLSMIFKPYKSDILLLSYVNSFVSPALAVFFMLRTLFSIIRQIRTKQLVKQLLSYRLVKAYKKFIHKKPLMIRMGIVFLLLGLAYAILLFLMRMEFYYGRQVGRDVTITVQLIALVLLFIATFAAFLRFVWSVQKLAFGVEKVKNLEQPEPNTIRQYEPLHNDYENLLAMGDTVAKSVDEAVKTEHMKVELLTNVSHDLKTPLTSIISYIDLLSKTELSDEARDYVSILQRKSERLSGIVCDVFELAKINSGEVPVEMERLDMRKLLLQTLGDMEDKIEASGRIVKEVIPDESIYINADGKRIYRVFQNLLDNALKYSMNGSRIFVELQRFEHIARLVITNTSAYEIEFTAEEMKERFTRGDKSRSSEGSGLGLSIADSFVSACGGEFDVFIDGDQFRSIVKFETV